MYRAAEILTPMIPYAGVFNAVDTTVRIATVLPYVGELLHFTGSETPQIKEFHKAMEFLQTAYNSERKDVREITNAAHHVHEKLQPLLENKAGYWDNFKGWSRILSWTNMSWKREDRWKNYLKPLHDLNKELGKLQKGASSSTGYDLDRLGIPIKGAIEFVNREIRAQTGFANKVAKGMVGGTTAAVTEKYEDLTGVHAPKKKIHTPTPPLMKLLNDIGQFKTDSAMPDYLAEDRLQEDIVALGKSHRFFSDLPNFIKIKNPENKPLLGQIDELVTDYIVDTINHLEHDGSRNLIYQAIHDIAYRNHRETAGELTAEEQIEYGAITIKEYLGDATERKELWQAVAYVLDMDKISTLGASLNVEEGTTLSELSEKIDHALSFLSSVRRVPEAEKMLKSLTTRIGLFARSTHDMVKEQLEPEERAKVEETLQSAHRKLDRSDYEGALRKLKTLYEEGPVAKLAVESHTEESPLSAVLKLATDSATTQERTTAEPIDLSTDQLVQEKKAAFVESLTFFAAFQAIDGYCGYKGSEAEPEAVQKRYLHFYQNLEGITDPDARKAKLIELLNQKMNTRENLNFFERLVGKQLSSFTVQLVEYFSNQFTNVATEHLQALMMDPINDPLANNDMGPLKAANRAMLSLLFAEAQWADDTTGSLGAPLGKQQRIFDIIERNGNVSTQKLFKRVIKKAIDSMTTQPAFGDVFKGTKKVVLDFEDRGRNVFTRALAILASGIGSLILTTISIPIYLLWVMSAYAQKAGTSLLVSRLNLVNTVLDTIRDSMYDDKKYTSGFDKILLDQLKAVEKLLGQEGDSTGELLAGDNEKRLVSELVNNVFRLIDKRGQLSPEKAKTRDNLLSEFSDALHSQSDKVIKTIVRDLIIFSYESIRDEQGIHEFFVNVLEQATQSLKPDDTARLWELYSATELKELGADQSKPETLSILEEDFARKLGRVNRDGVGVPTMILKRDIDQALSHLYAQRQNEIHGVLDRLLQRTVEKAVKTRVDGFLTTPQDTILGLVTFLENQLLPHVQIRQTRRGETTYIEEMYKMARKGDFEGLKKKQCHFLNQLHTLLGEMEARKGKDSRIDLQMQMLERRVSQLINFDLRPLSAAIASGDAKKVKKRIRHLQKSMRTVEETLVAIRYGIKTQKKTMMDDLSQRAKSFVKWGAENVSPAIQTYVNSRVQPRAEEVLAMYKDPSVFTAIFREGLRGFNGYERVQQTVNPSKRVGTPDYSVANREGFEVVGQ